MCRVQMFGIVDRAIRLICCASTAAAIRRSGRAAPLFHVKQASSSQRAVGAIVRHRSGRRAGSSRAGRPLPADMRDQEGQRRRRDAVDPAGLADGARAVRVQLLPDLVREALHAGVVEIVRQLEAFVPAVRLDVGGLPVEIDRIFGVDFELLGDLRREFARARGQIRATSASQVRIGQQLERRPPLAVVVERNPVLFRLVRRDRQRIRQRPRRLQTPPSLASNCALRERRRRSRSRCPSRSGAGRHCRPASVSRYSAREVNIRYGSVTPRVTRSSIMTPR